ncbi:hypothetical protein pb186bvf_000334 [Paramecium bursaria]
MKYKVNEFHVHTQRRLSRERQNKSVHEILERTGREFYNSQITQFANHVRYESDYKDNGYSTPVRLNNKIFLNPKQIMIKVQKRELSKQEAEYRIQQYNEREERKKLLFNEPFMQIYLKRLKAKSFRLPVILS